MILPFLRRALAALENLVFPRDAVCLGCGKACGGQPLCPDCRIELGMARVRPENQPGDDVRAVWVYQSVAGRLVRSIKDRGVEEAACVLAEGMAAFLRENSMVEDFTVTWVPMPDSRRRVRGVDHARVLAEALGREAGLPVRQTLRRRPGSTHRTQRGLNREQRIVNVRNAFEAVGTPPPRLILVDDVRTTGTTCDTCAGVLREAGAERVAVLTATWSIREQYNQ